MIYIGSDTIFYWDGLADSVSGSYINDATVTGSLMDLDEIEITPFNLDYVAASSGDYKGSIPASTSETLSPCGEYIVEITAIHGSQTEKRRERHKANYRGYK